MKFVGDSNGGTYFSCRLNHEKRDVGKICADVCYSVLAGERYQNLLKVVAWGYDGKSPDLLSVGVLSITLGGFTSEMGFNCKVCWRYYSKNGDRLLPTPRYKLRFRDRVLKLYRKFTQQVVSKLPDNWEMTTAEIKAWIKDHNKLPACIKHQPNQRKHGKEKAETRQGSVV